MDFLAMMNASEQADRLVKVESKLNELVMTVNRLADLLELEKRDTSEDG